MSNSKSQFGMAVVAMPTLVMDGKLIVVVIGWLGGRPALTRASSCGFPVGDLGEGDVALEIDVHRRAVRRADAPGRRRLEEDADVPAPGVVPIAREIGVGEVGEACR